MYSLIISFAVLIIGYMVFSQIANKVFKPDSRKTPAIAINDGVDCVAMGKPKLFLVQLLNIAGTGPIFGPIMGAVFGPVVFLWIIFGTILGGAVHDFMVGMISSRHKGASIAELSGIYIGKWLKYFMRGFSVLLLILCGTVFLVTPANILASLTPEHLNFWFWVILIIAYYFLATILPIDKIIGKLYPIFGALLFIMAFSVIGGLAAQGYIAKMPEFWTSLTWNHPKGLPMWPCMFVTVACGAISGFHATQSPMVAKCIQNENQGRQVFYGAMVGEAIIALIWAAAGVAFYGCAEALQAAIDAGTAGGVVTEISKAVLGPFGGVLAIIGVVVCPITSGDTAFRGARLIVAEATNLDQKKIRNRLILTVPVVAAGVGLAFLDFNVLWRYFAAANQTLAMIALWVASFYLLKKNQYKHADFITAIPAAFMVAVSITYIVVAQECCNAPLIIGYPIGTAFAVVSFIAYLIYRGIYLRKHRSENRQLMIHYNLRERKRAKQLIKDFKIELLLHKYYVVQPRDIDSMLLRSLVSYKEDYEFLQKLRIGSRVEEILTLQERLVKLKKKTSKGYVNFFNACYRPILRFEIFCKRFSAKFIKRKPMNIAIYYHGFKYNMKYALKHGVIYTSKRGSWDSYMIVFPNNFQRINRISFRALPIKIISFFTGKSFEIQRSLEFNDACRFHIPNNLNNRYWYIYEFMPNQDQKASRKLLKFLTDFTDSNHLKVYADVLNNFNAKYFQSLHFKPVVNDMVDYAKIPHTVYLKTPTKA